MCSRVPRSRNSRELWSLQWWTRRRGRFGLYLEPVATSASFLYHISRIAAKAFFFNTKSKKKRAEVKLLEEGWSFVSLHQTLRKVQLHTCTCLKRHDIIMAVGVSRNGHWHEYIGLNPHRHLLAGGLTRKRCVNRGRECPLALWSAVKNTCLP